MNFYSIALSHISTLLSRLFGAKVRADWEARIKSVVGDIEECRWALNKQMFMTKESKSKISDMLSAEVFSRFSA